MKFFITGANGFLGSALKNRLIEDGGHVEGCDISGKFTDPGAFIFKDRADSKSVLDYLTSKQPEVIYHFAAVSTRQMAEQNVLECYETNVLATVRLASVAREINAKFVFMSSYLVEKDSSVYGESKLASERAITRIKGLDYSIVRLNSVFGPGDHSKTRIIPRTIRLVLEGKRPKIDQPNTEISLDYIDDALDFVLKSSKEYGIKKKDPDFVTTNGVVGIAIESVINEKLSTIDLRFLDRIKKTVDWVRKTLD